MTPTDYCKIVENRLGWAPPATGPAWRRYTTEAAKVKRKIATDPSKYTWENLLLAVELLVRERQSRTPIGVFAHVDRALDLALDKEDDLELLIREAVEYETHRGDPQGWVTRFARAVGGYRRLVLDEWRESVK